MKSKTLIILTAMTLVLAGPILAGGDKPKYPPSVDPVLIENYYDALFQITPYCNATVGTLNKFSQITEPVKYQQWSNCYDCKREQVSIQFLSQFPSLQFDVDKYGALCPN